MRQIEGFSSKWSYVTRLLPDGEYTLAPQVRASQSGDVVVAKVTTLSAHDHLEDGFGRRCRLYPGDLVVGACGNRYATDAFEGYVPVGDSCHLLTAGGLIGSVASAHDSLPPPSELTILGHLEMDGRLVTSDVGALPADSGEDTDALTVVVVGSSMNAGKTTTVTSLVRGFEGAGLRAGAGKVTGSGSGKDRWAYIDAGASDVADFLDFGMPSTFGYPIERLRRTMRAIHCRLASSCDVVVLEIADGVLQDDTSALLQDVKAVADAVVVAVADPLAAKAAVDVVAAASLPVVCVTGLVTRSALAAREASRATGLPVLGPAELASGDVLALLPQRAEL